MKTIPKCRWGWHINIVNNSLRDLRGEIFTTKDTKNIGILPEMANLGVPAEPWESPVVSEDSRLLIMRGPLGTTDGVDAQRNYFLGFV